MPSNFRNFATMNATERKQPLVSIIIPVYNGKDYLRQCIDSITAQTCGDWELLLIDDGSSDGSGAICDEYAANDSRITAIHKSNGGQASARNQGMALAKGEYVSFVDCDDWLDNDMLATMLATLRDNDAEIVVCGFTEEYAAHRKTVNADGGTTVLAAGEALKMLLEGKIGSYLWSMMFRRSVVVETMPDLNPYEDHATVFKWFGHATRVVVLGRAFYHYRQLQGSSLHSYNPKNGNHFFLAIKERYHYIADHGLLPGWEKENRALYLRSCIKLTKDLARMDDYDEQIRQIIVDVSEEIRRLLPVGRGEIGTKGFIRLKLLMMNVDTFVRAMRLSSLFAFSKRRKDRQRM